MSTALISRFLTSKVKHMERNKGKTRPKKQNKNTTLTTGGHGGRDRRNVLISICAVLHLNRDHTLIIPQRCSSS